VLNDNRTYHIVDVWSADDNHVAFDVQHGSLRLMRHEIRRIENSGDGVIIAGKNHVVAYRNQPVHAYSGYNMTYASLVELAGWIVDKYNGNPAPITTYRLG